MRRLMVWIAMIGFSLGVYAGTEPDLLREARWLPVDTSQTLPEDLAAPEGRTLWDWTGLATGDAWIRALVADPQQPSRIRLLDRGPEEGATPGEPVLFDDLSGGPAAERWLLPERDPGLLSSGRSERLTLSEVKGYRTERLWIETRRVGAGRLRMPSGSREVVLQWAVVYRESADGGDFEPETALHRWIDAREGVVAEVWGPASRDGLSRLEITGAAVVEETLAGKQALRVYANELDRAPHVRLAYGYDRGEGIPLASVEAGAHTSIGDLINATSWDFSGNTAANAADLIASTATTVSQDETCSYNQCGFNIPGVKLGREDKNFADVENADITTTVQEREDRAADVTLWLRAGVNKEGQVGSLGTGESRFCYAESGIPEVPLWRMSHYDAVADDYYLQNGDTWQQDPIFDNDLVFFSHVCPNSCGAATCEACARSCDGGAFAGRFYSAVVNEGPVTLPSGHTFEALVVRNVADFCAYGFFCTIRGDDVRTVTYLWEVPRLGTVARLVSPQVAFSVTDFIEGADDTLAETDIKYGLFPPLSISASNITDTTVDISWDPGTITGHISDYKIYWDTDSGLDSDYANSMVQPASSGTTATIGPLLPDTQYFFTVTALADYANPAAQVTRTYESVRFPTTVPAVPNPIPVEVTATTQGTTCIPTDEVAAVTVNKVAGEIEICWDTATDACLAAYEIMDAASPELPGNFELLYEVTPPETCRTVTEAELDTFIQVRIKGTGGSGP